LVYEKGQEHSLFVIYCLARLFLC